MLREDAAVRLEAAVKTMVSLESRKTNGLTGSVRRPTGVTRHSKYVTFQLAEVAVTRNLFAAILDRIAQLAIPPPVVGLIRA
jgi:hypothetical protein